MFPWARFEKLIEALLEINRRCARHVIQVVTLAVPRERRPHRRAITRMKKIIRTGEVLLPGKRGRRIAKVRRVIIKEFAAILSRRTAREREPHRGHRLHRGRFDAEEPDTPLA